MYDTPRVRKVVYATKMISGQGKAIGKASKYNDAHTTYARSGWI